MDFSYNSDWNNFVKTECEKLRKKGHTFDAEGTHMKIIGEKYQKKLAREAKAKSKKSQPISTPLSSQPKKLTGALAKADAAYYIHMREKEEAAAKAKQHEERKAAKAKAKCEELSKVAYDAYIRQKQQEELAKVQKEAEAKRIQDIAAAKALQGLLEVREREAKTKEEERIRAIIEAEKHREELEKANARAKEAEELVKAMERDQIAKSNARAKELEEIVNAANAIANEREKIVKLNQEEELKKIKAQLEKEREEFEKFKSLTIERENLAVVNSSSTCNSVSKFAIALQGEIERRKHDKNPIKFKFQRKIKFISKLEIALKEVLSRRGKIQTS